MLQAIIGAVVGVGLYLILADALRVPFLATVTASNNLAKRQEKKTSSIEIWLESLAMWISKKLRLNEYKRLQLETDLRSAGMNISPEMHTANSMHFTPIWYPDGNYSVAIVATDVWTPAGMIESRRNSNVIAITESVYDDWYIR